MQIILVLKSRKLRLESSHDDPCCRGPFLKQDCRIIMMVAVAGVAAILIEHGYVLLLLDYDVDERLNRAAALIF